MGKAHVWKSVFKQSREQTAGFCNTVDNREILKFAHIALDLDSNHTGRKLPTMAIKSGFLSENVLILLSS